MAAGDSPANTRINVGASVPLVRLSAYSAHGLRLHPAAESSDSHAQSTQHFAPSQACNRERSAARILHQPLPFQRDSQQSCPDGPAQMTTPFAPIQACKRKAAAQPPSLGDINPQRLKFL